MAIDPQLLAQVLRTPRSRDVTESPIVRAVVLADPANAAALVPALERGDTIEAYNARRVLCRFEADAVPHVIAALGPAGPRGRKEGLEVLWALLVGEEPRAVREALAAVRPGLDALLGDGRPLPDEMPAHIERDFRGRVCDLAFLVIQQLVRPDYDQSPFRSLDEGGRDDEIRRLQARGIGLGLA